jgi:hypothetical protein
LPCGPQPPASGLKAAGVPSIFIKDVVDVPLEVVYPAVPLRRPGGIPCRPILSHEDMNLYASVSIVGGLLKIAMVILLKFIIFDKLVLYGLLILIITFLIMPAYR